MRYVAAYLLAVLGGNKAPSQKDIEKILGSVGIDAEAENIKKVIDELKGKDIAEVIEAGHRKLASVPTGAPMAAAPAGGAPAAAGGAAPAKEEKKKEVKKEESEESEEDMGFGLFD